MTRLLAAVVLLGLLVSGTALAAVAKHGDPQKRIRPADQARAKAMVLKRSDLPDGFRKSPSQPDSGHYYCRALDQSDLTVTGYAESGDFESGVHFVSSLAQVFRTVGEARTSWRRGSSAAGTRCTKRLLADEFAKAGIKVRSFKKIAFPRVAGRSVATRMTLTSQGVSVFIDVISMERSRAQAGLIVGAPLAPFPKAETVRLARIVAGRMATAMRGA